jgi:hypothetical protein
MGTGTMLLGEEIKDLLDGINQEGRGPALGLDPGECEQLEAVVRRHPDLWPAGLAGMFLALRRRLDCDPAGREEVPGPLLDFFDAKFRRDLDPMTLARRIGSDIHGACEDCTCRC